jgi:hypothetical protein
MEVPSRELPAADPVPATSTVPQIAVPVSPSPPTSQDNTAPGVARTDASGPSPARPQPTSGPSVNLWDERYESRTDLRVFAPQFGPRRAYYGGPQKQF